MSFTVAAAAAAVGGAIKLAETILGKIAPVAQQIEAGIISNPEKVAELEALVNRNADEIAALKARWDSMAPEPTD